MSFNLSGRGRVLVLLGTVVLLALVADQGVRAWDRGLRQIQKRDQFLRREWGRVSGLLARAPEVEHAFSSLEARYPGYFLPADPTHLMAELDSIAKASGMQVEMIRPVPDDKTSRYELTLRGGWGPFMKFLKQAESPDHLFEFHSASIQRQELSGELVVSLQALRPNF